MIENTSTLWRFRGSAVLFRSALLARIIGEPDVAVVSLREALSWVGSMPATPPAARNGAPAKTILIGGLDPILELLPVKESEDFLRGRCRRLISVLQDRWQEVGLVFGTNISSDSQRVDHQEHVLLMRGDGVELQLSSLLWNGAAGRDLNELKVSEQARAQGVVEGYYVGRSS